MPPVIIIKQDLGPAKTGYPDPVLRRDKTGQRRDLELSGDGDLEGGTSGGIDAGG